MYDFVRCLFYFAVCAVIGPLFFLREVGHLLALTVIGATICRWYDHKLRPPGWDGYAYCRRCDGLVKAE